MLLALAVRSRLEKPLGAPIGCGTTNGICQSCVDFDVTHPYWQSGPNQCRTCAYMNANLPYFDQSSMRCVDQCPDSAPAVNVKLDKFKYDYVCRKCSDLYPTVTAPLYWNPNVRECVAKCPVETQERGTTRVCFTCKEIATAYPMWDTTVEKCVSACPNTTTKLTFKEYNSTCICVVNCTDQGTKYPYYYSSGCKACASVHNQDQGIWDPNTRACVPECPLETPLNALDGYACVTCSDVHNASSHWDGNACAYCPASAPNWHPVKQQCVQSCPDATPVWDQHLCTFCEIAFPEKKTPYWDTNSRTCVASCPSGVGLRAGSPFCQTCDEAGNATPVWNGDRCVSCFERDPTKPLWDSASRSCVACPAGSSNWNAAAAQCQADCGPDLPHWNGANCVLCADAGLKRDGAACVASCPKWFQDEKTGELQCTDKCPHWWYSEVGGFCRDEEWHKGLLLLGLIGFTIVALVQGATLFLLFKKDDVPLLRKIGGKSQHKKPLLPEGDGSGPDDHGVDYTEAPNIDMIEQTIL